MLNIEPALTVAESYWNGASWQQAAEAAVSGKSGAEDVAVEAPKRFEHTQDPYWLIPWGLALWKLGRHSDAAQALQMAGPNLDGCVEYLILKGMVLRQLPNGKPEALKAYQQALALDPNRSDIPYNIGNLVREDDPEAAEKAYRSSISLGNQSHLIWHNLGLAVNDLGRHQEALSLFKTSLLLNPSDADTWCNAGLALFSDEQFERAIPFFHFSLTLDSHHSASLINIGQALINELRPEEAIAYLSKGIALDGSSTNSLWNLALGKLLLGEFSEGWQLYETRFDTKQFSATKFPTSGKRVLALEDLPGPEGPELVVWSEQGLGDAIQFIRYLKLLEARRVPFRFHTRPQLVSLFQQWSVFGDRVELEKTQDPSSDHRPHLPLLSFPHIFKTELSTIPSALPYLRAPGPAPEHLLVPPPPGGIAVGLVWASNPDNKSMYRHKSMPLELLMPKLSELLDLDLIDLHTLQFGSDGSQLDPWRGHERITDWSQTLKDFSDTAHVIQQLDLLITVDTAAAHLAGALNKPCWLLLPANADFRWLKGRAESPWYPNGMRLFRQAGRNNWSSVVAQLHEAFDDLFQLQLGPLAAAKLGR